jgi:NitT/TauT family transport system substrate-binding protein
LDARPDAFGALGRAVAKATLFALTNPMAAIELLWKHYPDTAPPAAERKQAFARELAALSVRLNGQRVEGMSDSRWGAITEQEAAAYQDFLLRTGALKTRREPAVYFSNRLVAYFNRFDPAPVIAAARSFGK